MAFTYDAGLRIRPPEPLPECVEGMSAQDYFALVLSQCSLESATSAENNSGDSAPTPFNIGQIQADVARNTASITTLSTEVAEVQEAVGDVQGTFTGGTKSYAIGATSVSLGFPTAGEWHVAIAPVGVAAASVVVAINQSGFTITFTAAAAAGAFSWVAFKSA